MKYIRGGIMTLLLKEVEPGDKKNEQPGKKLWRVKIGGELIGFIQTGWSRNKRFKYTATNRFGREYDSCATFMKALSQFIDAAKDALDGQGAIEKNYLGRTLVTENGRFHVFDVFYANPVMWYRMRTSEGNMSTIPPFDLRFGTLIGSMVIE
ncbi:hypothetical protein JC221_056 [Yersinia phage JC221]|nr:hypothetical protein JC221_056 [Yersinia phage JC221]